PAAGDCGCGTNQERKVIMQHRPLSARVAFLDLAVVLALAAGLSGCPKDKSSGVASVTGNATNGKTAVMKYGCMGCHGSDMDGSITPYPGTTAYAANLTPDKDTGIGEWEAATIKTAILSGRDDEGKQLCSTMPKFQDMNMTDTEANDVVAYLKSLSAVKKDVP